MAKRIDAGKLDRLIEIYAPPAGGKNGFGEHTGAAVKVYTGYAAKEEQKSGQADDESDYQDKLVITSSTIVWYIRWTPLPVHPNMWVMYHGIKYHLIQVPVELGRKDFLKLVTEVKDNV